MIKVADIMTRSVLQLSRQTLITDAVKALAELDVGGAPVCEPDGAVVGCFSKGDAADGLSRSEAPRTVGETMTHEVLAIQPEALVVEAIRKMVFEGVWRLFVIDERGELCGVVTAGDVMRSIADGHVELRAAAVPISVREERELGQRTGPGLPTLSPRP